MSQVAGCAASVMLQGMEGGSCSGGCTAGQADQSCQADEHNLPVALPASLETRG